LFLQKSRISIILRSDNHLYFSSFKNITKQYKRNIGSQNILYLHHYIVFCSNIIIVSFSFIQCIAIYLCFIIQVSVFAVVKSRRNIYCQLIFLVLPFRHYFYTKICIIGVQHTPIETLKSSKNVSGLPTKVHCLGSFRRWEVSIRWGFSVYIYVMLSLKLSNYI